LIFLTDQDARPQGSAHPSTHLWDNGPNAVDEMTHILQVRKTALNRFSENNIREGAPMATLEEVLVPIYLYHRYQIEAVAKVLGGVNYTYALRGDGQKPLEIVPAEEQRRALESLLKTLQPEVLALPLSVLQLIPPHPSGYDRTREVFQLHTGMTFDPLAAAETAADMTVRMLLHPERAARLIEHHALDNRYPGLDEVIDRMLTSTWKANSGAGYDAELRRTVNMVVLTRLMGLAVDSNASNQTRAIAAAEIESLRRWLGSRPQTGPQSAERAADLYALWQIKLFQEDPKKMQITAPPDPPAGAPIGSFDCQVP
jgi:hypothetical protein